MSTPSNPSAPSPASVWIGAHQDNWQRSRLAPIDSICMHLMDGTLLGTDAWFRMSILERQASFDRSRTKIIAAPSSAHYGIGARGERHQYVRDTDTAYHAGPVHNPTWKLYSQRVGNNSRSIGIEHEGRVKIGGNLSVPLPELEIAASAELVAMLCRLYKIPCDREHIYGHHEVYSLKTCPGLDFPFEEIIARAAATVLSGVS